MRDRTPRVSMTAQTRYRIIDNEGVVILQEAGEVLILNEVGTRILELAEDPITVHQIMDQLHSEFEVSRSLLETEVRAFLDRLLEIGVLENDSE